MSWRTVVITTNAKLDYQLGCLVVRKDTVTKIHLSEISVLMIESTAVSGKIAVQGSLSCFLHGGTGFEWTFEADEGIGG